MDLNKTPRLLIMMFIQYFMQGAWNMTMGLVLSTYGMATIIGSSYALLGLAWRLFFPRYLLAWSPTAFFRHKKSWRSCI